MYGPLLFLYKTWGRRRRGKGLKPFPIRSSVNSVCIIAEMAGKFLCPSIKRLHVRHCTWITMLLLQMMYVPTQDSLSEEGCLPTELWDSPKMKYLLSSDEAWWLRNGVGLADFTDASRLGLRCDSDITTNSEYCFPNFPLLDLNAVSLEDTVIFKKVLSAMRSTIRYIHSASGGIFSVKIGPMFHNSRSGERACAM